MPNPSHLTTLFPLFKHQLVGCNLRPGETCLVVTDNAFNPLYAEAAFTAALDLGAEAVKLELPAAGPLPERIFTAALQSADLLVYSTTRALHYAPPVRAGLARGLRALMAVQPVHALARLRADPAVRRRARAGAARLAAADGIRITTPAGADLHMRRGDRPALANYGLADEPGRLDFWGGGMVQTAPLEGTLEGRLVLDTGDLAFYLNRYIEHPVTITFERGRVVAVEGGLDALLIRETIAAHREDAAWNAGHIAWGVDHRALWSALAQGFGDPLPSAADAESYYGNVQVEIGSNDDAAFQGRNRSTAHLGHCLLHASLYLDDEPVIRDGQFVPEDLQ